MPNEVPAEFTDGSIDFELRRTYEGMVHCLDSGIGNVTKALQSKGMFEKTLIIFSCKQRTFLPPESCCLCFFPFLIHHLLFMVSRQRGARGREFWWKQLPAAWYEIWRF